MVQINNFAKGLIFAAISTLAFGAAHASDGTVTVTGQVNANTCVIVGNGIAGTNSFTVAMTPSTVSKLTVVNSTDGTTTFTIGVTGCGAGAGATSMNTYFESGSSVNAKGRLSNTGGSATNVEAQILYGASGSTVVNLGSGTSNGFGMGSGSAGTSATAISGGAATQTYRVRYFSLGGATAGTFSASFTYTLVYT
jgi:major type 1 subunit fimbrin (pilin)